MKSKVLPTAAFLMLFVAFTWASVSFPIHVYNLIIESAHNGDFSITNYLTYFMLSIFWMATVIDAVFSLIAIKNIWKD